MIVVKTARLGVDGYDITLELGDERLGTGEVETAYKMFVSSKDEPGQGVGDNLHTGPFLSSPLSIIDPKEAFDVCFEAIEELAKPEDQTKVSRSLASWYREH